MELKRGKIIFDKNLYDIMVVRKSDDQRRRKSKVELKI